MVSGMMSASPCFTCLRSTRLIFNTSINDELEMRCGDFPMFRGPVGRRQDSIAVRIEKYIPPDKDSSS